MSVDFFVKNVIGKHEQDFKTSLATELRYSGLPQSGKIRFYSRSGKSQGVLYQVRDFLNPCSKSVKSQGILFSHSVKSQRTILDFFVSVGGNPDTVLRHSSSLKEWVTPKNIFLFNAYKNLALNSATHQSFSL